MPTTIRFSWQTIQTIEKPTFGEPLPANLYNAHELPGFFKGISTRDKTLYHPLQLGPKNLIHLRLRQELQAKFGINIRERNFPYVLDIPELGSGIRFGAFFHFYLPNILSTRFVCHSFVNFDESEAFKQRQLSNYPVFKEVIKCCAKAAGVNGEGSLMSKSTIEIILDQTKSIESETKYLAALLINDRNIQNISVQEEIHNKNKIHNMKGEIDRVILIDKQGFLSALKYVRSHDVTIREEIKRKNHLFELVIAI